MTHDPASHLLVTGQAGEIAALQAENARLREADGERDALHEECKRLGQLLAEAEREANLLRGTLRAEEVVERDVGRVLRHCEWAGWAVNDYGTVSVCPSCRAEAHTRTHASDCLLGSLLALVYNDTALAGKAAP